MWTGDASETTFGKYFECTQIVFTIEPPTVNVTGVTLNPTSTSLTVGGTETLTATVAPDDATDKSVTWSSDNENVATVDANGLVTAVAPGTANITVTTTDGSKTATCAVTVNKAACSISYDTASVSKAFGDAAFTNTLTNTGDGSASYSSDDTSVATVNATTGEVSIIGVGTATITATVEDSANYTYAVKTASYTLNVSAAAMSVSASGYTGAYDGNPHGITVSVTAPTSGYTVKYGRTEGTYDLDESPAITNAAKAFDFDTPITANVTVYAKWTAIGYTMTSITGTTADTSDSWTKGTTTEVVITIKPDEGEDHSFAHFTGVQIDGRTLKRDTDYTAREGSTIVTLKPAMLQELSVGAHTVTINFDNGSVETRLTIQAAPGSSSSPKTGDTSLTALWAVLMAVSGIAFGGMILADNKRRKARTH